MFHDDCTWCVRPEGTPKAVALLVTLRTWPACWVITEADRFVTTVLLPDDY